MLRGLVFVAEGCGDDGPVRLQNGLAEGGGAGGSRGWSEGLGSAGAARRR
jgi:hypothetical protein